MHISNSRACTQEFLSFAKLLASQMPKRKNHIKLPSPSLEVTLLILPQSYVSKMLKA